MKWGGLATEDSRSPIRDLTVAAPLKRGANRTRSTPSTRGYPRPDGRGPIEALLSSIYARQTRLASTIRDLTVAAPLKRPTSLPGVIVTVTPAIRDLTVAAPLKRRWSSGATVARRLRVYPRPDGRGPIEAA